MDEVLSGQSTTYWPDLGNNAAKASGPQYLSDNLTFPRFSFPNGKAELHVGNVHAGSLHAVAKNAVAGEESVMGMTAYFYAKTSEPVSAETAHGNDGDHVTLSAPGAEVLE